MPAFYYKRKLERLDSLFFLLEVEPLFSEEKEVVSFLEQEDQEKVRSFESIAPRYFPIVGRKFENGCDCGGKIDRDSDYCVCNTCCKISISIENFDVAPDRSTNYDRKPKFRDCISRYQARQDVVIDKKLFEKYLSKHYADPSKVTKKQILMLTRLGMEDQVENLHLIHYELTGVPPKDIGHLESTLIRNFEVLMREKKGVVSVRQVLYDLLRKNGVECCRGEFGLRRK